MARIRPAAGRGRTLSGVAGVLQFRNRPMTIMRGLEQLDTGDLTDVGTVRYQHVMARLAETEDTSFDPASQTRRIIRTITCEFDAAVDVDTDDTLMDESTGSFYMIETMKLRPGIGLYPPAKILTLRMRSGVSAASDA